MRSGWVVVLAVVGAMACSKDAAPGADAGVETPSVEIYSWWLLGGEADALQKVIEAHKTAFPDVKIVNTAALTHVAGYDARVDLGTRMDAKNPPDLFQQTGPLATWLTRGSGIEQLDDFFVAQGYDTKTYAFLSDAVMVSGKRYAVPSNIGTHNVIYYNKKVFADHGLQPPTTWAEFVTVATALKNAGIAPLGMSRQGWIMRITFDAVLLASAPTRGQFLKDVYAGHADPATLKAAIANFDDLLKNYVNGDWATEDAKGDTVGWDALTQRLADGQIAMFLHGDWAKGLLDSKGKTAGVDYDAVMFPDGPNTNTYLYNTDAWCLPTGAKNTAGAKDFLATFLSPETQIAFAKLKGACPARKDVDFSALDPVAKATCSTISKTTFQISVREEFDSILQNAYNPHPDAGIPNVQDAVYNAIVAAYPPQ